MLALSNPGTKAECTAEEAFQWTEGKAAYASGTAFPPIKLADDRSYNPGQANNCLIFPGIFPCW